MNKKILLSLGAILAMVAGIAGMAAYEAHVINVTAHIENALTVDTTPIEFGTVFPQEYLERGFTINLSSSFLAADRVDDVEYVIKQKPKPNQAGIDSFSGDVVAAREYCHTVTLPDPYCYLTLCPFLSKIPADDEIGDIPELSYYDEVTNTCRPREEIEEMKIKTKELSKIKRTNNSLPKLLFSFIQSCSLLFKMVMECLRYLFL